MPKNVLYKKIYVALVNERIEPIGWYGQHTLLKKKKCFLHEPHPFFFIINDFLLIITIPIK